ncbi:MAG: GNAT family N-acetyltransferase [Gammaproteobacteria bacterium]
MQYRIRPADVVQDRDTILRLWRQVFPFPESHPVKYDWCYGQTPQGAGRLYLLEYADQTQVIGVQGIVPRRWWVKGEVVGCGICADLVVDQYHRSIGPALTLVRQVVEREQQEKQACLLYGFPNQKSEALYRRAGYSKMGMINRYAKPLRLHIWLRRKGLAKPLASTLGKVFDLVNQIRLSLRLRRSMQYGKLVELSQFDARFDELWSRVSKTAGPMAVRDSGFLQWRFGNNFAGQTRIMALQAMDDSIDGYIVYIVRQNKLITVLDFLASDNTTVLPVMLGLFAREMYRQGYHGVMLEFGGLADIAHCLQKLGFSLRETQPVYRVTELAGQQAEADALYLTSCDRDQ